MNRIWISYGSQIQKMTCELMEAAKVSEQIDSSMSVCIKPNLVVARPADGGATTHPEIVEGVLQYLRDHGVREIFIAEGAWVGDSTQRAWKTCGYSELSKRYNVDLIDTKQDAVVKREHNGLSLGICQSVLEADYLINVPVLKAHCQTDMTCCLKNLKGCIPDSEKRRYHTMGLHKPIATLSKLLTPNLNVVDSICGDLTFEEGGNPVESGRILLGYNPVLTDSYCAGLLGYHPDEIDHLRLAREMGVGAYCDGSTEIIEIGAEHKPQNSLVRSSVAKRLAQHVEEDGACSACYAALIFALNKTGGRHLPQPVKIGQGFRGKSSDGIGVGSCTKGCAKSVAGCPPQAVDIVDFLESLIS